MPEKDKIYVLVGFSYYRRVKIIGKSFSILNFGSLEREQLLSKVNLGFLERDFFFLDEVLRLPHKDFQLN